MNMEFNIPLFRENPEVSSTNICFDEVYPFIKLKSWSKERYWAKIELPDGRECVINIDELYNSAVALHAETKY